MTSQLFCFGLGYTGQVLARQSIAAGWRVSGTCRSANRAEALQRQGINAVVFDGQRAMSDAGGALVGATHLLVSIPPDEAGDPVLRLHGADLEAVAGSLRWIGYLSTIGVYGDCGGAWIDEMCEPRPATADNRRRLEAEQAWLAFGAGIGVPAHVFRLPGIYGPGAGRNVIDMLETGRARRIVKAGQVFNRIHVTDLAGVLAASMARPDPGRIYNVADDEPTPGDEVVAFAAELIGVEPPVAEPIEVDDLAPFAQHFYAECKRVRNERIQRELGFASLYPTYREGLRAIRDERIG